MKTMIDENFPGKDKLNKVTPKTMATTTGVNIPEGARNTITNAKREILRRDYMKLGEESSRHVIAALCLLVERNPGTRVELIAKDENSDMVLRTISEQDGQVLDSGFIKSKNRDFRNLECRERPMDDEKLTKKIDEKEALSVELQALLQSCLLGPSETEHSLLLARRALQFADVLQELTDLRRAVVEPQDISSTERSYKVEAVSIMFGPMIKLAQLVGIDTVGIDGTHLKDGKRSQKDSDGNKGQFLVLEGKSTIKKIYCIGVVFCYSENFDNYQLLADSAGRAGFHLDRHGLTVIADRSQAVQKLFQGFSRSRTRFCEVHIIKNLVENLKIDTGIQNKVRDCFRAASKINSTVKWVCRLKELNQGAL